TIRVVAQGGASAGGDRVGVERGVGLRADIQRQGGNDEEEDRFHILLFGLGGIGGNFSRAVCADGCCVGGGFGRRCFWRGRCGGGGRACFWRRRGLWLRAG